MNGKDKRQSRNMAAVEEAASLIARALDLIDGNDGPAEAGAHLDLVLTILRNHIAAQSPREHGG